MDGWNGITGRNEGLGGMGCMPTDLECGGCNMAIEICGILDHSRSAVIAVKHVWFCHNDGS